jgi:hypothetical protein
MDSEKEIKEMLYKLTKKVDRIDQRLAINATKTDKQTWVKVSTVTELTGWDRERLRGARENKTIIYKKNSSGFWYLLESIPERLIRKSKV